MKILVTIIPANLVTNLSLSLFCLFLETKNKNQTFTKLMIWSKEIFLLFAYSVFALYYKGIPNSIEFYKRIFLHIVLVSIIVPCSINSLND